MRTPMAQRALAGAIGALLVAAGVSAVTLETDDATTARAGAGAASQAADAVAGEAVPATNPDGSPIPASDGGPGPEQPGGAADPTSGAPGAGGGNGAAGDGATTGGPAAGTAPPTGSARGTGKQSVTPPAAGGVAVEPAAPGTYRYTDRFVTDGEAGEASEEKVVVQPVRGSGGERRQAHVEGEGEGMSETSEFVWRSGGVYVDFIDSGPSEGSCDLEPDILVYQSPLGVGAEWSTDSRCQATDGTSLRIVASSRVVRIERVAVGGQEVDAHVIETTGYFESSSAYGSGRIDFDATEHFAVSVGLSVREAKTFRFTDGGEAVGGGREERELMSLTPG